MYIPKQFEIKKLAVAVIYLRIGMKQRWRPYLELCAYQFI